MARMRTSPETTVLNMPVLSVRLCIGDALEVTELPGLGRSVMISKSEGETQSTEFLAACGRMCVRDVRKSLMRRRIVAPGFFFSELFR